MVGDGAGGSMQDTAYTLGAMQVCQGRKSVEAVGGPAVSPGVLGRWRWQPVWATEDRQQDGEAWDVGSRPGRVAVAGQGAVGL